MKRKQFKSNISNTPRKVPQDSSSNSSPMKRYKITCTINWSMEEMSESDHFFDLVNGSPLIALSTCVEVEGDKSLAFTRGQLRILDAMGPDYKLPPTPTPKLDALQKERDELVASGLRKKSFSILDLIKEKKNLS